MTKTILRVTLGGIFLVITAFLVLFAYFLPSVFFSFYPEFSRYLQTVIAGATSVVPFAVCEICGILLLALFLFTMIRAILKRHVIRWIAGVFLVLSIGVFAFVGLWGLNYYAPPMAERLGLKERQFTVYELQKATEYYRDMANAVAKNVERKGNGAMRQYDFDHLAEHAGEGYEILAQDYACFDGSTVRVKSLICSPILGKVSMTGGFICLTGEACVSDTTYAAAMPFTMCHEIGHRMAFAREDEANFAGFLACSASERPEFIYSGYYMAFKYCYNALAKVDTAAAQRVWAGVGEELAADCGASAKHYEEIRSEAASDIADSVYSGYLNAFSVETGTQSYGEVADLLILWYQESLS